MNELNQNVSKSHLEYIDFLGVISAFAVVVLHVNEVVHKFSYDGYWFTANIIECVMYFAVPVFLFISAGTLLDYRERYDTKEFFRKRLFKTLIPFIIWSLVAMVAQIILRGGSAEELSSIKDLTPWYIIDGIINFKFLSIYSFFGYLFGMYLAIPVLSNLNDKEKTMKYMVVVGLVFNCFLPLISDLAGVEYHFITFELCYGYTIYLPLGYLLVKMDFTKKQRAGIYIVGFIGLVGQIIGMYVLSIKDGNINEIVKGYTKLPGIIYSTSIFVFLRYAYPFFQQKCKKLSIIVKSISGYTFGIYLIHIYAIRAIKIIFKPNIYDLSYRLIVPFIVFPISIVIVWIIRKIPKVGIVLLPK